MAKLIITEDGRDKVYEIVDESFTIGSGPDADLQLRSEGIAPLHVTIKKTKAGFRLSDMETKEGTTVNGKTVNEHVLANGDTIRVADVKITYIGKGPARAAAPKETGPKLESSKYYRHAEPKKTSTGQLVTIALGALAGLVLLGWLVLGSSDPADIDRVDARLSEAIRLTDGGGTSDEYKTKVQEILEEYKDQSQLSDKQKEKYKRLKNNWSKVEETLGSIELRKEAQTAFVDLWNTHLKEPEAFDKQERMAKDWLAKYAELGTAEKERVETMLAGLEAAKNATPDEKEMLRVKASVLAAIESKDLWSGKRAINQMDQKVRLGQPEFVADMEKRLRQRSRQWLGVRKNDVREFLRDDKYDPAKARQIAIDTIFTKLIYSTIEDYLSSPDKYSQPNNQEAELKTQALLKELLGQMKPDY